MKPNAAQAAMARPVASIAIALAMIASPALAGDRALLDVIGFSADGRYFAFEEYGVQDGSGFPYSTIYVVDVVEDEWVGTPTRVMLEDEEATLFAARAEAQEQAASALSSSKIDYPADIVAMQADGEGGDGLSLDFAGPGYGPGELTPEAYSLSLSTFSALSPQPCEDYMGEKPKGFVLTLSDGQTTGSIHKDGVTIPNSRGCPWTYRIYAVVVPQYFEPKQGVAIVSVYPFAFEGPDRRFIAIPLAN